MGFSPDYPSKPPKCMSNCAEFRVFLSLPSLMFVVIAGYCSLATTNHSQASSFLRSSIQTSIHRELFACPFSMKKRGGDQLLAWNRFCWEFKICSMIPTPTVLRKAKRTVYLSTTKQNISSECGQRPKRTCLSRRRHRHHGNSTLTVQSNMFTKNSTPTIYQQCAQSFSEKTCHILL